MSLTRGLAGGGAVQYKTWEFLDEASKVEARTAMHAAALATCVKGGKETKVDLAPQGHARNYRVLSTYAVDCKSMTGGYRIISVIKSVHARLMQLRHLNQIRSHIATTIQHPDSRLGRWKRLVLDGVGIPRRGKQRRGAHASVHIFSFPLSM